MEILVCKDVKRTFGQGDGSVRALDGASLSVDKGEFVAITGASGSGKSTLLHIIAGVEKADAGSVTVDGLEITTLDRTQSALFRRRKIGLIYQFYNLIPTLNIKSNILLPLSLDGKKPDADYFDRIIDILGIRDKLDALPSRLSGGQQQRAAIARGLMTRPALVLADEPTGNLDSENTLKTMELLTRTNRELGQTVVVVTHDDNVAKFASRVITIKDGRVEEA